MSEVQSRPSASTRGRGSAGRGRGGYSTRGGGRAPNRSISNTNGDSKHDADSALPSLDDEGEIGELNKLYGSKVTIIREMFPDWSNVDVLFALRETDGDENLAVTRIAEGTISQWGEVSKPKKERVRPKAKNDTFTTTTADSVPRTTRGGRTEGGRGRGRATERGGRGGAGRGKAAPATTNGTSKDTADLSVPTEEAWDTPKPADEKPAWGENTAAPVAAEPTPAAAPAVAAPKVDAPKTWASMLRQATVPKPAPKPKEAPAPTPAEPVIEPLPPAEPVQEEAEPVVESEEEATPEPIKEKPVPAPAEITVVVPEIALPPSKDQLTETNLEQIPNTAKEIETETNVSEAADSWDPRAQPTSNNATPLSASQQQHQAARTPVSGFATTATKAADRSSTRTPNFPRRILDQREAVRMPGNRDQVDRAAVQFGAFSLNDEDDIDGDREEPETRAPPPEDSPVTHPRTSLPPAQPAPVPEPFPAQKPAVALPPTGPAAAAPPSAPSQPSAPAQGGFYPRSSHLSSAIDRSQHSHIPPPAAAPAPSVQNTQQFGRFGQPVPQEPASFPSAKPFDSYGQQPNASATSQYDTGFQSQAQTTQPQQPGGAYTSAPSDYSHYAVDAQSRHAYNNYYNQHYAQQGVQGQQDAVPSQPQRSFSGYNAPQADNLSQYPQTNAQHSQSRFGAAAGAESQITGTPTPSQSTSQSQTAQSTHAQSHSQQPQDYPYTHPYYNNPYYSSYVQGGYQGGGYGGYGPYGKGGYQPNQYGMSPQGPHQYGSSPAAGFSQSALHRDSGVGSGVGEYGRAASGQSGQQQGLGASGFGGMHDTFGRGASSYQSQAGQSFNAPGSQPGSGPSAADDLKPFGDAKAGSGPSPSLVAAARPGSAANNVPSQSGLPPPQSNQQSGLGMGGYTGYPSHLQQQAGHGLHGNQTGAGSGYGMSASGGAAAGHQNSYGGYGQGFGGGSYGYGGNPPRGWGNNYH